jgi:hypothetical protein
MGARMHALRLTLLPLLVATSLAAQSPTSSSNSAPAAVAPGRSVFFDVAALVGSRQRLGLEPVVLGRWTVGFIVTRVDTGGTSQGQVNLPFGLFQVSLPCPAPGCSGTYVTPTYIAWSVDVAVRYYPPLRSRRFMLYLGEFLGYDWRTFGAGVNSYRAGLEPGAEIGLRARALGPLFVDVGGWFKLVRLDDPTQNVRPGGIDSRFVAAVGVGW